MNNDDSIRSLIQNRDPDGLAAYVEQNRARLLGFIESRLGTALRRKVEADDVLQEVITDAVKALPKVDLSSGDPFGWLCHIAERRIIDAHRHFFQSQKRDAAREMNLGGGGQGGEEKDNFINMLVASITSPSAAFSRNAKEARLQEAMAQLPDLAREAIKLRYVDGLPSKEIAERLEKSDGAIRVLLTRSLKQLRDLLDIK